MSYFDELGGDAVVLDPASFARLGGDERTAFLVRAAEGMAPAILGRVALEGDVVAIRGRFGVHAALVELAATGVFVLRVATRRALGASFVVSGPPNDSSRRLLDELEHGTGALLNRLLDSIAGHAGALAFREHELVLSLPEPAKIVLSTNPEQRLTSVAHLTAYLAHEAEQRWPRDPNEPLRTISVDFDAERRALGWTDEDEHAPPVPLYGMPPPDRY